jgi:hypothetical protein
MTELLFIAAALVGLWIYKTSRTNKLPNRLLELEQALQTHADLRLHRNKDVAGSAQLTELAAALRRSQHLLNESNESVRANWSRLRPQMLHLTSEDALKSVDLFYTDRREEFKAAIYHLIGHLDKLERKATTQGKSAL